MTATALIVRTASTLPDAVVSNREIGERLVAGVQLDDEAAEAIVAKVRERSELIEKKTGLHARRFFDPGDSPVTVGLELLERLMAADAWSGLDALIVSSSSTHGFPGISQQIVARAPNPARGPGGPHSSSISAAMPAPASCTDSRSARVRSRRWAFAASPASRSNSRRAASPTIRSTSAPARSSGTRPPVCCSPSARPQVRRDPLDTRELDDRRRNDRDDQGGGACRPRISGLTCRSRCAGHGGPAGRRGRDQDPGPGNPALPGRGRPHRLADTAPGEPHADPDPRLPTRRASTDRGCAHRSPTRATPRARAFRCCSTSWCGAPACDPANSRCWSVSGPAIRSAPPCSSSADRQATGLARHSTDRRNTRTRMAALGAREPARGSWRTRCIRLRGFGRPVVWRIGRSANSHHDRNASGALRDRGESCGIP